MKKALLLSVLLIAVVFTSWATGAQDGGGDGTTELRIAWWGNPTRDERTLAVIDMYQEVNPDVIIEPETVGWGGYWDRINTQVAAGSLPDVMQHDYAYLLQFASRKQVADMTPFVDSGIINLDGVDETYLSGGRVDGKLYGISLGTNAVAMVYDPGMLKAAGVAEPTLDWTMDDFAAAARQVFASTGVQTVPFFTTDPKVGFENWIRQTGYPMFDPSGKSIGFKNISELEAFFALQVQLIAEGVMIPAEESFVTLSPQEGFLAQGGSWVDFIWSNQFVSTQDAVDRPLKMTLVPAIANGDRPGTYLKPSMFFSIPEVSEEKEEAAKFVDFFLNDPDANMVLLGERGVPITPEVREIVKANVPGAMQQIFDFISLVGNGYASPIDPPDPAASGEFLKMFRDVTMETLMGIVTPAEGAAKVESQGNSILSR